MTYNIRFKRSAQKALGNLDAHLRARLESKIANLGAEPRPAGCKQLREFGTDRFWRIRVGQWRVIYRIDDDSREIDIRAVEHRREAYRR